MDSVLSSVDMEAIQSLQKPTARSFVILYALHIFTTAIIPITLFVLGWISAIQSIILVIAIAGAWTWIGAYSMKSENVKQLRNLYIIVGSILVALAAILYGISV
jgi:hypothetical protein